MSERFFPIPAEDALPEGLRKLFGKARERLGFVPNVFRVYSYRPERFSAWFAHFKLLHEPTEHLSAADREMIAVVVSAWNRCTYCLVSHGHALWNELGGRPEDKVLADYVAANWRSAGLDARRAAICAYAEKLTATPWLVDDGDLAGLQAQGLTREEVWDVAEIASMYNFTNRLAHATRQLPNREYHASPVQP